MPNKGSKKTDGGEGPWAPYHYKVEYIADLLLELKEMARNERLHTLTGILDLAHAEARLRCKDAAKDRVI